MREIQKIDQTVKCLMDSTTQIVVHPLDVASIEKVKETEKAVCYTATFSVLTPSMIAHDNCSEPAKWTRNVWFPKAWIRDGFIESKYVLRKAQEQNKEWAEKYGARVISISF